MDPFTLAIIGLLGGGGLGALTNSKDPLKGALMGGLTGALGGGLGGLLFPGMAGAAGAATSGAANAASSALGSGIGEAAAAATPELALEGAITSSPALMEGAGAGATGTAGTASFQPASLSQLVGGGPLTGPAGVGGSSFMGQLPNQMVADAASKAPVAPVAAGGNSAVKNLMLLNALRGQMPQKKKNVQNISSMTPSMLKMSPFQ